MKVKFLAAAVAALGSAAAFAAPLVPATTTPSVLFYVTGASAQKVAVAAVVPATVFAVAADVVKITTPATNTTNASTGWLGMSKAALTGGTSVPTLVLYNNTNGSAAGVNQLLSTTATEAEAFTMSLPDATCTALPAVAPWTSTCSSQVAHETDLALSDVGLGEFAPTGVLRSVPGVTYIANSAVTSVATGLEGFGVIVNKKLYSALQAQNVNEGLLPATCAPLPVAPSTVSISTGTIVNGGACQPSLRSADYTTIAQSGGSFGGSEALALVPSQAAAMVYLCRRDDLSGTQAASNIQFLNSACGLAGYGGALTPATDPVAPATTNTAGLTVIAAADSSTEKVESPCVTVTGATGYALGVVSLGESDEADVAYAGTKNFYFVKIDGASPNFIGATLDATHRTAIMNGNYKFATDMVALTRNTIAGNAATIATALINDIKNSTLSSLTGIAYLDLPLQWGIDGKNAKYSHGGNNCAPLH
jgi:hypothetical protein